MECLVCANAVQGLGNKSCNCPSGTYGETPSKKGSSISTIKDSNIDPSLTEVQYTCYPCNPKCKEC